jgi:NAD-dependent dihydropyrimidine dehydrogenase PreA subunit
MKPIINDKKCCANQNKCQPIKNCPTGAISYIEVAEAITDREKCECGCDCNTFTPSPYGRIIIDYDLCSECGACIDDCCGNAIYSEEQSCSSKNNSCC